MKTLNVEIYLDQEAVEQLNPSDLEQIRLRIAALQDELNKYTYALKKLEIEKLEKRKRSQG